MSWTGNVKDLVLAKEKLFQGKAMEYIKKKNWRLKKPPLIFMSMSILLRQAFRELLGVYAKVMMDCTESKYLIAISFIMSQS